MIVHVLVTYNFSCILVNYAWSSVGFNVPLFFFFRCECELLEEQSVVTKFAPESVLTDVCFMGCCLEDCAFNFDACLSS